MIWLWEMSSSCCIGDSSFCQCGGGVLWSTPSNGVMVMQRVFPQQGKGDDHNEHHEADLFIMKLMIYAGEHHQQL